MQRIGVASDSDDDEIDGLPLVATPQMGMEGVVTHAHAGRSRALSLVTGTTARVATPYLSIVEACVGFFVRGMTLAVPSPRISFMSPSWLGSVARDLALTGNSVHRLTYDERIMAVRVDPVAGFEVRGGSPDPRDWRYRVSEAVPSGSYRESTVPSADVLHFRVNAAASTPWSGVSPLDRSIATLNLSALAEVSLAGELSLPVFGAVQTDMHDSSAWDVMAAGGGAFGLVRSGHGGDDVNAQTKPAVRMRPEPDAETLAARRQAAASIASAFGIPPQLVAEQDSADAASREAWRRFVHSALPVYGTAISEEIQTKIGVSTDWDYSELRAADIMGRARAFASMTKAGMSMSDAAANAGLEIGEHT